MSDKKNISPILLCILDGWGVSPNNNKNAVKEANTPIIDDLFSKYPNTLISASGLDVGLPDQQVGNSEVGHMAIGSGRIINNNLVRIENSIKQNSLSKIKTISDFSKTLLKSKGSVHLMGLLSDGGVHSKSNHIIELSKIFVSKGLKVILHLFTDGRDTLPKISDKIIKVFINKLPKGVEIGTIMGRFYSMDRDNRWERIQLAWQAIVLSKAKYYSSNAINAIKEAYKRNETDEFISPTVIKNENGKIFEGIKDGDGIFSANFRADRMRQILTSILDNKFKKFQILKRPKLASNLGMVSYSENLDIFMSSIFPNEIPTNTLSEVISKHGLKQLKIAETEKYAHVTFFLNGGEEKNFSHEERVLIPSPKVLTYDIEPKMSGQKIMNSTIKSIREKKHSLIVVNFANPDMVGHTGNFNAVKKSLEFLDNCIGEILATLLKANGIMILTSDHGNCEVMWDEKNLSPHTAHTNNKVPFILIGCENKVNLKKGSLRDIAPTILNLLCIEIPKDMTGKNLII